MAAINIPEDNDPLGRSFYTKRPLTGIPQFDSGAVGKRYMARKESQGQKLNREMGHSLRSQQGHGGFAITPPVAGADNTKPGTPPPPEKLATPAEPQGGSKPLSNVVSWDAMTAAQNKDFGALSNQYDQALNRGNASEFVKGTVPTWGGNEMALINKGIRDRGQAGATLDKRPTGANVSVTEGYDYASQQKRLQAIDPEKYGGAPKVGGLPEGYQDLNTRSMSFGQLAGAAAKNRALMEGQDHQAAFRVAEMQKGDNTARDALYGAQVGEAQSRARLTESQTRSREMVAEAEDIVSNPGAYHTSVVSRARAFLQQAADEKIRIEVAKQRAMMGEPVEGYAAGGAIPAYGAAPQMQSPVLAEYGQYLQAAAQSKVQPVPFAQYVNLLSSTRGQMDQTPTRFADGGEVTKGEAIDVAGKKLVGPGTGTSDSIPAVIDGKRPAALSTGEYVIPSHVVRAKGTEFFDKLIAQYANDEGKDNG